jgi:hypothetical protein
MTSHFGARYPHLMSVLYGFYGLSLCTISLHWRYDVVSRLNTLLSPIRDSNDAERLEVCTSLESWYQVLKSQALSRCVNRKFSRSVNKA